MVSIIWEGWNTNGLRKLCWKYFYQWHHLEYDHWDLILSYSWRTIWPGVGHIFQMSCFRLVMIFVQTDMNVAHPYSSIVCIVCWFPINSMASWQTSSQKKKSSPFLQDNEWTKWKLLLMITSQFRQLIFHFLSEISSVYYFALLFVIKLLWLQLKHCYTYTLCFLDTSYWILYTSTPTYSYPYMFLH